MRRRIALATLLALAALGTTAATARAPLAIGIAEREFHISSYRSTVKPGPVRFYVSNLGQDTHNLVVRGPRGFSAATTEIKAGQRATLTATLRRPGTYVLLCTRANHARIGMKAKLVVLR
jgi:plastocyanin